MSLPIIFLPEFYEDVREAVTWFNSRAPGLGGKFTADLASALNVIVANPRAYPVVQGEVRQAIIRRFRFRLFYALRDSSLIFIGTVHGARDVEEWLRSRLGGA
ncbi:MAG: hypothetical protein H6841_05730 [Planctomycetes bacterium]|nr:hypothetical protein [Planctomycetota bacterium]MCB9934345.1 hypothetical protein [Planctomycetota bacterium]